MEIKVNLEEIGILAEIEHYKPLVPAKSTFNPDDPVYSSPPEDEEIEGFVSAIVINGEKIPIDELNPKDTLNKLLLSLWVASYDNIKDQLEDMGDYR